MSAAEKLAPTITEPLSWAEICELHPDSWVCLVEMEREAANGAAIKSARIISHGKTRKESLAQIEVWGKPYPIVGHFFTGKIKPPVRTFPGS